jgi:hypothetical protein
MGLNAMLTKPLLLLLVAASAVTTDVYLARTQASYGELLRAAVIYVQRDKANYKQGVLKIDSRIPTVVGGGVRMLAVTTNASRHDSTAMALAQIPAVAEVVTPERARLCGSFAPLSCMSNGVSVVAAFGVPHISNDTATINVLISMSEFVSAADSLELMKRPGGRMNIRILRSGGSSGILTAARERNTWRIIGLRILSKT